MSDGTPIRLAVNGALGRMGRYVLEIAAADPSFRITAALERPGHPELGRDAGLCSGAGAKWGVSVTEPWEGDADVLIDFSLPPSSLRRLEEAAKGKCAAVVATTGFTPEERAKVEGYAATIPVLLSPNFSFGVNFLLAIAEGMAAELKDDFDIEIVEAHHNRKVDAPSGTALAIAESLARGAGWNLDDVGIYGRKGQVGARPRKEIAVHTVRAGDIVGDHKVIFGGTGETIEISHRALSRSVFAKGAVKAAKFLAGKPAGLYSMRDLFA